MSPSTACALEVMVRLRLLSPIGLTNAWFFKKMNHWFDLMCSHHPCFALNLQKPTKHSEASLKGKLRLGQITKWTAPVSGFLSIMFPNQLFCIPPCNSEALALLESFIDLFTAIQISDGTWKPVHTGVLLSTTSILGLQTQLLQQDGFSFVLKSRFTRDSRKNLFSMICLENPIPAPYQCKVALRVLTVSRYLEVPRNER